MKKKKVHCFRRWWHSYCLFTHTSIPPPHTHTHWSIFIYMLKVKKEEAAAVIYISILMAASSRLDRRERYRPNDWRKKKGITVALLLRGDCENLRQDIRMLDKVAFWIVFGLVDSPNKNVTEWAVKSWLLTCQWLAGFQFDVGRNELT